MYFRVCHLIYIAEGNRKWYIENSINFLNRKSEFIIKSDVCLLTTRKETRLELRNPNKILLVFLEDKLD